MKTDLAKRKLGIRSVIGYGAGDFANNLAFSLSTTFLLLYYTDVVGLPAAAIGTMFLIVRLWDAFADLFAGRMVDRTMTRWGKFRPFILFGSIPLLVMSVLTFYVPQGWDGGAQLLYAYVTYAVLGLIYSMVNVPYGSLATAMTQVSRQRAKLAVARGLGAGLGGLLLAFIISPQIQKITSNKALSAQERAEQMQSVFLTTTLAFVALGFALYFLTFLWCKEVVVRIEPRVSIKDTFRTLKTNKPLGILCLSSFFYLIGAFAVGGATAFYSIYVLGDAKYIIWITLLSRARQLRHRTVRPCAGGPFRQEEPVPVLRDLHRRRRCRAVLRPRQPAAAGPAVRGRSRASGVSLINTLMFALEADTVEYGEWKTNQRTEGATYAIFSFTRKITQSIGGALGAFALALGGYITKLAADQVQPESAIIAIKASMGLIPAAAAIIAMLAFIAYPLTEKRYAEIVDENDARKEKVLADQSVAPVPMPPGI